MRIVDQYEAQLAELGAIRHPDLRGNPPAQRRAIRSWLQAHAQGKALADCGIWVYFSWSKTLEHYLEESLHQELRTARNKCLITPDEQEQFYHCRIAIAGLSVGSHAAASIALSGGGKEMRLADPDAISGSNLNRIRAGFDAVGVNKAIHAARELYGMNPYAALRIFSAGIAPKTVRAFLTTPAKADVLIEETDDLPMKILLRKEAKALRIPVLMAADNGDGVLLDVERYDHDASLPILYGRGERVTPQLLRDATPHERARIITDLIGPDDVAPRMHASIQDVGRTLYSWPQLGGAAQLAGVALAYATRMIATAGPLKHGRIRISLEELISRRPLT